MFLFHFSNIYKHCEFKTHSMKWSARMNYHLNGLWVQLTNPMKSFFMEKKLDSSNPSAWMKWILINESIIIDWMNSVDDYVQNAMTWIFQGCKMTQLDEMSCNEWMRQSYETSCCSKWNKFHPWITINEWINLHS